MLDNPGLLIKVKNHMNREVYVGISVSTIMSLGRLAMEDAQTCNVKLQGEKPKESTRTVIYISKRIW